MSKLEYLIERISTERGIDHDVFRAALRDFLSGMHEIKIKQWKQEGSLVAQSYFALGAESAYHLGGLLATYDDVGILLTEMKLLDPRLARFKTTIDRWEQERDWEIEDGQ